jgi:ornithine cyclodeaminase
MSARIVGRARIESVLPRVDVIAAMEEAFVAYSSGLSIVPPVGELLFEDPPGDAHIKYGYIKGDDIFVIKVATGFYDNPKTGLAPNSGLMLAFDAATGFISAVLLDEGHLTNVRTAAAGAVAARHLMPPTVDAIGVLGTGLQARMQVEALGAVTPVRRVVVWGRRRDAAELCAADLSARGFETDVADTPQDVAARANLIVTATASHAPLLAAGDVRPGTHITAMGSDTETKQELDTALVARADRLVADSLAQCRERGEISHALRCGAIAPEVPVELGDVIRGRAPGRLRAQDITIADLTGVAVQDIAVTKAVLSLL